MDENLPIIIDEEPHLRRKHRRMKKRVVIVLLAAIVICASAAVLAMTGTFGKISGKSNSENAKTDVPPSNTDIYSFDRATVPDGARAVVPTDISGGESVLPVVPAICGRVIVIASHPYEAYSESEISYIGEDFSAVGGENTTARLAEYIASSLKTLGIDAEYLPIEITSARGSYAKASEAIEQYGKENAVGCVIDVHRAALKNENGDIVRPITEKNGMTAAQTALIVASDAESDETRAGYAAALAEKMNEKCLRSALVKTTDGELSQNACGVFITADIGSVGNSYAEAVRGAGILADAFAEMIKR